MSDWVFPNAWVALVPKLQLRETGSWSFLH